jgi:hypothetical protein
MAEIFDPVVTEPVNAIFDTNGWRVNGSPASGPSPVTMFITPSGSATCLRIAPNSSADSGVNSDGFNTPVHPAAKHGATFQDNCEFKEEGKL